MSNVARSLNSIAGDIRAHHHKVKTAHETALAHASHAGDALAEAKQQVKHGEWAVWLETNAPDVSPRTAQIYMRLADHWEEIAEKCAESAHLSIDQATKLIAKPKPKSSGAQGAGATASKSGPNGDSSPSDEKSGAGNDGAQNAPEPPSDGQQGEGEGWETVGDEPEGSGPEIIIIHMPYDAESAANVLIQSFDVDFLEDVFEELKQIGVLA